VTYAALFPGQASQHADMLSWLESEPAATSILRSMCLILGSDWRDRLHDARWRNSNAVAQVLITGSSLAACAVLAPLLPGPPAVVAGYSVGELAALSCTGAVSAESALALAADRAAAMDRSVRGHATGLLSVCGLDEHTLSGLCDALGLEIAIRIAVDRVVVAGEHESLQEAQRRLAQRGTACRRLPIELASHSSWMRGASGEFAASLAQLHLGPLQCPMALNADGLPTRRLEAVKAGLSRQVSATVQWAACMETIVESGVSCVIEVGAGRALSTLWRQQYRGLPVRALDEFRQANSVAKWVERMS